MKKIINKKEYNTETATIIYKFAYGNYGDPNGYEETLYQTPDGYYFIYRCGGSNSPYPSEVILRITKSKVQKWIESHQ